MRTSYSSLETYRTCPLKYKYQEIDKIRAPKSIEAVFGSTIHSALKYMFERSPLYPTIDEIIDFFRNKWETNNSAFESPEQEKAFYEQGIDLLKKFYKTNQPWNFNVVDLESRFEIEIENTKSKEKHILAGIIDRIDKNHEDDGSYEIIDYKTAKRMPSQDALDEDLQMSLYHLALSKRWPQMSPQKIKLSLYFLKHGEKISTSRSDKDIKKTKEFVINTINEIKKNIENNYDFPPTPSALCDWCGYKKMCPMWKHLYDSSQSTVDSNQIKNFIKEFFELKTENDKNDEKIDELKEIIKNFMDEQKIDRVFGDEGYITRKMQERFSYDLAEVQKILEPINKWADIFSADEKKIEEIMPTLDDDTQQKIISLRKIKQFSTITASKNKIKK